MSIRHTELSDLVDRMHAGQKPSEADLELLRAYAEPGEGLIVEDQLDGLTIEMVEALTGEQDVWSPERAAAKLLLTLGLVES